MEEPQKKAGYLILRLDPGQGFVIELNGKPQLVLGPIEVRLAERQPHSSQSVAIAVSAPKEFLIKRID